MPQTNVLIDRNGTPRIGGLGNASILPHSTPWTEVGAAKVNDMFALGILAREVRIYSFGPRPSSIHALEAGFHS